MAEISNGDLNLIPYSYREPAFNEFEQEGLLMDLLNEYQVSIDDVSPYEATWPYNGNNYGFPNHQSSLQFTNPIPPSNPFTSYNFPQIDYQNQKEFDFESKPNFSHPEINLSVEKPSDDGFNWRKYGQKQLKDGKYPKSYYRCTNQNCVVKKTIERSSEGHITDITYQGKHNHKELREIQISEGENEICFSKSDKEEFSDEMGNSEVLMDGGDSEIEKKQVENEGSSSYGKKRREPKIIFETRSDIDLLDDGYRWRKYGQKSVKGNTHPRSYYKCTYTKCNVRKQIERASKDSKTVFTTYEGKHIHDPPPVNARSSATTVTNNIIIINNNNHSHFNANICIKRDPTLINDSSFDLID
ncbi:hypothetical protein LUZ60_010146 [Juncus effusus]|nr:hypothetical protein LUZ60_010146 [Juncus effusus]